MKIKTLAISVAALAALSAIVYVVRRPEAPPSSDPRIGRAVAEPSVIEKAAKIRVSDQGKSVELAREADGTWRVVSYHDLPADFAKLSQFANDLSGSKISRLVSSRPDVIARLEFKDTQIALHDDAGKELLAAALGKRPDSGGRYLRYGQENKAYLADLNLWLDVEPKNWANSRLLTLKPEDIASLEIPLVDGSAVSVSRKQKDDAWTAAATPEGKRLKTGALTSLLATLTSLNFSNTTDPTDGKAVAAKAHARTFKLTAFDGKTYTVALGRKPEEEMPKAPQPAKTDTTTPPAQSAEKPAAKQPASTEATPPAPQFETIPAGPVFAFVTASDEKASVNALMKKRAFEIAEYQFTTLPQKADDVFEPAPPPPAPTSPSPATSATSDGTASK